MGVERRREEMKEEKKKGNGKGDEERSEGNVWRGSNKGNNGQ
jgi:hypothetical protein